MNRECLDSDDEDDWKVPQTYTQLVRTTNNDTAQPVIGANMAFTMGRADEEYADPPATDEPPAKRARGRPRSAATVARVQTAARQARGIAKQAVAFRSFFSAPTDEGVSEHADEGTDGDDGGDETSVPEGTGDVEEVDEEFE
jgi:hypothetical protein